jgi:hypothetical protein
MERSIVTYSPPQSPIKQALTTQTWRENAHRSATNLVPARRSSSPLDRPPPGSAFRYWKIPLASVLAFEEKWEI